MSYKTHTKELLFIAIFVFISVFAARPYISGSPIKNLQNKLEVLIRQYQQEASDSTLQQINAIEGEIVEHIARNGYDAVVETEQEQKLFVLDTTDNSKVLATLLDGAAIKIFERRYNGTFIILTSEGIKGFLVHDKFNPSLSSFPLKALVEKTMPTSTVATPNTMESSVKIPKTTIDKTLHSVKRKPYKKQPSPRGTSSKVCISSRCTGRTQKGARCKRRTKNCNRRCYQH